MFPQGALQPQRLLTSSRSCPDKSTRLNHLGLVGRLLRKSAAARRCCCRQKKGSKEKEKKGKSGEKERRKKEADEDVRIVSLVNRRESRVCISNSTVSERGWGGEEGLDESKCENCIGAPAGTGPGWTGLFFFIFFFFLFHFFLSFSPSVYDNLFDSVAGSSMGHVNVNASGDSVHV